MPTVVEEGGQVGGLHSILNLVGQSRYASSGWSTFTLKSLIIANCGAAVFGLAAEILLSEFTGPCISFMAGSAFGFLGGIVHRWRADLREAKLVRSRYPRLIAHHVQTATYVVPPVDSPANMCLRELEKSPPGEGPLARMKRLISTLSCQGYVIAGLYSAANSLERLRAAEEEWVISKVSTRMSEQDD